MAKKDYSDAWTDYTEAEMIEHLNEVYADAWKGLDEKQRSFFAHYQTQYEEYKEKIEEGSLLLPNGEKADDEWLQNWLSNQIKQDERWKALRAEMAKKMTQTNQMAADYVNGKTPEIFAENHNYAAYQIDSVAGTTLTAVDPNTVKRLAEGKNASEFKVTAVGNDPVVDDEGYTYRRLQVDPDVDYEWNYSQIQKHLTSGILQGKSAQGIANSFYQVMKNNRSAAIRNARTAITSAQNGGRQQTYNEAVAMGIELQKEWMATRDERTRDSHAELHGVRVGHDEKFPNGLLHPGDPSGKPSEVYNCRCTMRAILPGINDSKVWRYRDKKTGELVIEENTHTVLSYRQWLGEKQSMHKFQTLIKAEINKGDTLVHVDLSDAEKYATRFLDGSIGSKVSYEGLDVETANTINWTLEKMYTLFKIPKLKIICTTISNKEYTKGENDLGNSLAGTIAENGVLVINGIRFATLGDCDNSIVRDASSIKRYLRTRVLPNVDLELAYIYENSVISRRGSVAFSPEEVIIHEVGHLLENEIKNTEWWDIIEENFPTYAKQISGYSTKNISEYIAESFVSFVRGETKIDPYLEFAFIDMMR